MNDDVILKDIDSVRNWFSKHKMYKPDSVVYFWTLSSLSAGGIRNMMEKAMIDDSRMKQHIEFLRRVAPESKKDKNLKKIFKVIDRQDLENSKIIPLMLFTIDFILRALSTNKSFYDDFFNDVKIPARLLQKISKNTELNAWVLNLAVSLKILEMGSIHRSDQGRSRGYRIHPNHLCDPTNIIMKERCADTTIAENVLESKRKSDNGKKDNDKIIYENPVLLYSYYYLNRLKVEYNAAMKALKEWKKEQLKDIDTSNTKKLTDVAKFYMKFFSYAVAINRFEEKDYYISRDDYGRVHSNLTNFPRILRPYLYFEGCNEPLYQLDLSNSQPLLLTFQFPEYFKIKYKKRLYTYEKIIDFCGKRNISDISKYFDLVINGKLYPELYRIHKKLRRPLIRKLTPEEKEKIKDLFYKLLFGRDVDIKRIAAFAKAFETAFPTVWEVIKYAKGKSHKDLAHNLQKTESDIFINAVLRPLLVKEHQPFILSIHDCIVCGESQIPMVKQKIIEAFSKAPFKLHYATLKIEGLNGDHVEKNETVKLVISPES